MYLKSTVQSQGPKTLCCYNSIDFYIELQVVRYNFCANVHFFQHIFKHNTKCDQMYKIFFILHRIILAMENRTLIFQKYVSTQGF